MQIKSTIASAIATSALVFQLLAPAALAATDLTISGNGSNSDSNVTVSNSNTKDVVQTNTLKVDNNVKVDSSTGNNQASGNTGGNVTVDTGTAKTDVSLTTVGNSNAATVDGCNCDGATDVTISGNGTGSSNDATVKEANKTAVWQDNKADVKNKVDVKADSGKNKTNDNTGGDVTVTTGAVNTTLDVATMANRNSAVVSGGNGDSNSGVSARIIGNGSYSDNAVNLGLLKSIRLTQFNDARVNNDLRVDGSSGNNKLGNNTGGDVSLDTGDVTADVSVDTLVNSNVAATDCGCAFDVMAKVSGNGTRSDNTIKAYMDDALGVYQDNAADHLKNKVSLDADSGYNRLNDNTGEVDSASDPSSSTGMVDSAVAVATTANNNVYGSGSGDVMPTLDFGFDLGGLFGLMMLRH